MNMTLCARSKWEEAVYNAIADWPVQILGIQDQGRVAECKRMNMGMSNDVGSTAFCIL